MKHLLAFIILLFFFTFNCYSSPRTYTGFSSFAGMSLKYPCSKFLQISKNSHKPAMTVVLKTFGNSTQCISKFINKFKNKQHLLQIHIANETCRRVKGRCTDDEIMANLPVRKYNLMLEGKDLKAKILIQSRVKFVLREIIPLTNKNTWVLLSTGLEDNYTYKAFLNVKRWIRNARWSGGLVRNPLSTFCAFHNSSYLCELHAINSKFKNSFCIFNIDGNILPPNEQLNLFYKFKQCKALFAWEPKSQGRISSVFIKPKKRDFIISNSVINDYSKLLNDYATRR